VSQPSPDAKAVVRAIDALTTQVKRLADAQPTGVVRVGDDVTTTADDGEATCPTPLTHNWGCGCPTDQAPAADEGAPYLLRVLVDRAVRGVLSLPGEGEALRRRTEQMIAGRATWKAKAEEIERDRDEWQSRAEQAEDLLRVAHETSNRSEAERARTAAELEAADRIRAEAQRDRDQHAAVLREVLGLFDKVTGHGAVKGYHFSGVVDPEQFERWRSVVAPTVERPWWETVAEVRGELAEAQAAIKRVRAKVAEWRDWNEQETAWAVRDIEDALSNAPATEPLDGTEQPTTEA
jgi:hypothetical protein